MSLSSVVAPPRARSDGGIPWAWLTPRPARERPIHRWFVFPHSFAPQLAEQLLLDLGGRPGLTALDPFCGAGTVLVEAQKLELGAIGIDLLPLAALVSRAKTTRPRRSQLEHAIEQTRAAVERAVANGRPPGMLRKALGPTTYARLRAGLDANNGDAAGRCAKVAVLRAAQLASRLRADGGWLRSVKPAIQPGQIAADIARTGAEMANDLSHGKRARVDVLEADARAMPLEEDAVDVIVTSPPYPNRHDYTRVFGVELELAYGTRASVKELRYQALRSHPEARPQSAFDHRIYEAPRSLTRILRRVEAEHPDRRILRMLSGYFEDLHAVLTECRRVMKAGARAAFVVGNVSYCGQPVEVDRLLAELGTTCGLRHERTTAARMRGNSAQQMGHFGRRPSRESVVVFRRG